MTIEKIRINPYSLSATVEKFSLAKKEGAGHFVYFDKLYVNLESLSIFKKALIVQSISLAGPSVDFDFLGQQSYSFSDLLEGGVAEEKGEKSPGHALFSINNIEITAGNIRYHDLPKEKIHQVSSLTLSIPSVSNLPSSIEAYVQPAFSAVINGTEMSLGGQTKPFDDSLATEVDINIHGINIPEYLAYIPNPTGLTAKSAQMDIDTRLTYFSGKNKDARLSMTGSVTLRDLDVVDRQGQSYLKIPSFAVVMADSNLLAKEVRIAEITIDSPRVALARVAGGDLLPLSLLRSADNNGAGLSTVEPEEKESDQDPVTLSINRFNLEKGEVFFSDATLKTPFALKLSEISLGAISLSNIPGGAAGNISYGMLVNGTGKIAGKGSLALEPLALKSSLDIQAIRLKDFQSYISEQIRILIAGGTTSLQGEFEINTGSGGTPAINFSGRSSVADLSISDTVIGDDLLKWKDLQFKNINFTSSPPEFSIDEIGLQDLYAKILINDDGTMNLATLAVDNGESAGDSQAGLAPTGKDVASVAATGTKQNIAIKKVLFKNGQVQFVDKNIKPAYGAGLSQFNGSISGLSSQTESRAAVKFDGKIDQQAALHISGEINPLSQETFADIKIDFTDFNLSPLTPYTGKYVGYKTDKGKLNLDLHYQIQGKKLDSTNKAFLDQFTLGEGVESQEATSLPVNLAISLLKNRQGEIILDVPVSGDLDDPEFSIGGVVLSVIVNLIAKAATSPFALLGSLIPEGEDLQHIMFESGSSALADEAGEKMKLVAKVLYERPGLKMDMTGRVDQDLDRMALTKMRMAKMVKLEKLKMSGSGKDKNIDYDLIEVQPQEYTKYLTLAYKKALAEASAETRKAVREAKPASENEAISRMEEFLLAGIKIEDEDLRLLAIDRANNVLNFLVEEGQIDPGRLFMVEPQLPGAEDDKQEVSNTMVELSIK